jgi:putative phosphoribosyl transferase
MTSEQPPASERFRDRAEAGRRLALQLERFRDERPVVFAMPRGGVPVAAEVARALGAPLDVAIVRKVGAPRNPEFAIGAVAEGGTVVLSRSAIRSLRVSPRRTRSLLAAAERDLDAAIARYRRGAPPLEVSGRCAILVDDGLATGRSARAALRSLRARGAARLVLAVPVGAPSSLHALREEAEEIVCVRTPPEMWAIGLWYEDFEPTREEQVSALLAELGGTREP